MHFFVNIIIQLTLGTSDYLYSDFTCTFIVILSLLLLNFFILTK